MLTWLRDLVRNVPVREVLRARQTRVWIPAELVRAFVREAHEWSPRETGAALLGYRSDGAVVVCGLVGGGPRARHHKASFLPDGRWQVREIAWRYEASGRTHTYLGELHSHPAGGCGLSRRDCRTAQRIARHPAARAERPLMMVVARDRRHWTICAWELVDGALQECAVRIRPWRELFA